MFITAQIDLNAIGQNKELFREVQFKDGVHKLLNITIKDLRNPDDRGNNVFISCQPKNAQNDNKFFLGRGKAWPEHTTNNNGATNSAPASSSSSDDSDVPF